MNDEPQYEITIPGYQSLGPKAPACFICAPEPCITPDECGPAVEVSDGQER